MEPNLDGMVPTSVTTVAITPTPYDIRLTALGRALELARTNIEYDDPSHGEAIVATARVFETYLNGESK
ncbi:hypothetical protein SEA_BANTAM_100 [Gordonia phage Bantam]|uniref:Uncharacterized protein n=1 Tax=Gordonia phage Bantam TaxID=1887641 RepID=A0A1B3AYF5_9CAUD|nr:hypothetical protein BIZ77_gp079 [Gordonia phage Bantam]AOE43789.1 hypothetical protein SEA_BANTAM_100 [Gordonia phage Bantam]